jgi:plastocyanin
MRPLSIAQIIRTVAGLLLAAALLSGCGDERSPSGNEVRHRLVSVAIDNHFHDIHPEDHRRIAGSGTFVVRSEGLNLHNVTFVGTDIDEDLSPGETLTWDPVERYLPPGTYRLFCKYHDWAGMRGEITVVA